MTNLYQKLSILIISIFFVIPVNAIPTFIDITSSTPLGGNNDSWGVASADFDGNGWQDIVILNRFIYEHKLFLNHRGTFIDATSISGFEPVDVSLGVAVGDLNRDGSTDLAFLNWSDHSACIYLNNKQSSGTIFSNINRDRRIRFSDRAIDVNFWDLDNDGYLDIFDGGGNVFRNNGDSTFTPISIIGSDMGRISPLFTYLDDDLFGDIFYAYIHLFYRNNGGFTFSNVTSLYTSGDIASCQNGSFGDYDNDGDFDLFIIDGFGETNLYRRDGDVFNCVSASLGPTRHAYSRGSAFVDLDNDGDLDIVVNNTGVDPPYYRYAFLYINNGDGTFTESAIACGITHTGSGVGLTVADFDNDGDLDIFFVFQNTTCPNTLYQNQTNNSNWLKVRLLGVISNYSCIGARIYLYDSGYIGIPEHFRGVRMIESNYGGWGSTPLIAHFGVDSSRTYDIRVIFPSGMTLDTLNVHPTQTITLVEPTIPTIHIHLFAGWNLISIPVISSRTTSELLPGIISAYKYEPSSRRYSTAERFEPLTGYFVLSLHDTVYSLTGEMIIADNCELSSGWNLIGCPYSISSYPVSDLIYEPAEMIIHQAWWYEPSGRRYIISSNLVSTQGYWFLTLGAGRIRFPSTH